MARHKVSVSESQAVDHRVAQAMRGQTKGFAEKVEQIRLYILATAKDRYKGNTSKVPCPDAHEWAKLAGHLVLPPAVTLGICATPEMVEMAQRGDFRELFFGVAKKLV